MVRSVRRAWQPRSVVFAPLGDLGRAVRVEQRLSDAIRLGLLADGERLPSEQELAAMFGVATVTTREALQALRAEGLVRTVRGRGGGSFVQRSGRVGDAALGTRLAGMTRVELRDRATLYRTLWSGCVELAAGFAGEQDVADLRELREPGAAGGLAPAGTVLEPEPEPEPEVEVGVGAEEAVTVAWRHLATEFCLSVAALTQSARMTREMIVQEADFGVLLKMPLSRPEIRELTAECHGALTDAIAKHDADLARHTAQRYVDEMLAGLVEHHRAVR